jgi:hypothetical protein
MPENCAYQVVQPEDDDSTDDRQGLSQEKSATIYMSLDLRRKAIFIVAVGALLVVSFVLGSLLHPLSLTDVGESGLPSTPTDVRAFMPKFTKDTKSFEFDKAFANNPGPSVLAAWTSLIPNGQGVVHLPIRNELGTKTYNIAAFHTLHCLYTLRDSFFEFHDIATGGVPLNASKAEIMLSHGRHCIEYLRQSLTCNPDLTLEPIEIGGKGLKTWHVEHHCTSFEGLSKWAVENRLRDRHGIVT